jgi:hypothetical protein
MADIGEILASLAGTPPGPLPEATQRELETSLSSCWGLLDGSSAGGMEGRKLRNNRTEHMAWAPPILRFQIERHLAVVHGSSRAELQRWEVDLQSRTATLVSSGRRQIRPTAAPMDVGAIAAEIASIVNEGRDDVRIVRQDNTVRILTGDIIPSTNSQTTAGRRRRFSLELERLVLPQGWRRKPAGSRLVFERDSPK